MANEKTPLGNIASLGASAEQSCGLLDCRNARTVSLSCRGTYNGSATETIRVNCYFSADGVNYDTIPYAYFDVDLTAGSACQETHVIDTPEHGYMEVKVENIDSTYAATNVFVWSTIIRRINN